MLHPPPQESGAKWDAGLEQQLCYEVKTFLLAGHETSAAMLTWSVWEMMQPENKDMLAKVGGGFGVGSDCCWHGSMLKSHFAVAL